MGSYFDSTGNKRPVIASVASPGLRELVDTCGGWEETSELAIKTVELQLKTHQDYLEGVKSRQAQEETPFETAVREAAQKIGEDDPKANVEAILALPEVATRRAILKRETLPYTLFCAARTAGDAAEPERKRKRTQGDVSESTDVDEWVISNERWLRESKDQDADWTRGLVRFSKHADIVFDGSILSSSDRTLRRSPMTGYLILDGKRAEALQIQPSLDAFSTTFDSLTEGVFKGLDWSNVFVAGGIALASLLCTKSTPEHTDIHKHSDVDIYLYGLSPVEANKKIAHIFQTWKSNLPPGAPANIVRNSRTITFFSAYPTRRIQIVLKLVKHPKEVLLNFDLDVCSLGWDGEELWMLPRAARALETGYNVFTMNLIDGHYLGERRASQEKRVFKYADKGFGIRILPSYVEALPEYNADLDAISFGEDLQALDLDGIAAKATAWTGKVVKRGYMQGRTTKPTMSHTNLSEARMRTSEPQGQSCLSGFQLFMRHVALWNQSCAGHIILKNSEFASINYDENRGPIGYDDGPQYDWSPAFNFGDFQKAIGLANWREQDVLQESLRDSKLAQTWEAIPENEQTLIIKQVRRMTYGLTVAEVLDPKFDMIIPLWLPISVVKFANNLIDTALTAHGFSDPRDALILPFPMNDDDAKDEDIVLRFWRVTAITAWQQIDRRIDEMYEVLWCFHRANAKLAARMKPVFITHLSKRIIRRVPEDEYQSFARWVGRRPMKVHRETPSYQWRKFGFPSDRLEDTDPEDDDAWDDEDY